jgi:glutamyl/glutaminyl-tRNA synthetase
MFNFLANMGWSFDAEREIFTREEAITRFDVKDISAKATRCLSRSWNGSTASTSVQMTAAEQLKDALAPYMAAALGLDEAALAPGPRLID